MVSKQQNDFLTCVDPGSPMHALVKSYWLPLALSRDLPEADGNPIRLTALGEDYVCFRDSEGKLGLLRELCCHRGASLCLGRNEDGGLRCIYHGWKFAVDGRVLETPNTTDERFKTRYRQPWFLVREKAGLLWAFLGDPETAPPFPRYPFFEVPESHCIARAPVANANFVQMIEGLVDSSHLGVLHSDSLQRGGDQALNAADGERSTALFLDDLAPCLEAEDTPFGMRYAALRTIVENDGSTSTIARVTAFALPFLTFIAAQPGAGTCVLSLPVHTGKTIFFHLFWSESEIIAGTDREDATWEFVGLHDRAMQVFGLDAARRDLPDSAHRGNNWQQDRAAMKRGETFSGLMNFVPEDIAVMESMGRVYQREYECLTSTDLGVVRMRRVLVENAERVQRGEAPAGVDAAVMPLGLQASLPQGTDWRSLFRDRGAAADLLPA